MGRTRVILIDTHIVVWLALAPEKLSARARTAIDTARADGDGLAISAITLFELAMLADKGRIELAIGLESFLQEVESRLTVLPLTGRTCARAVQLSSAHSKDPADRLILATALNHGLPLLTADGKMRKGKLVRTIW